MHSDQRCVLRVSGSLICFSVCNDGALPVSLLTENDGLHKYKKAHLLKHNKHLLLLLTFLFNNRFVIPCVVILESIKMLVVGANYILTPILSLIA